MDGLECTEILLSQLERTNRLDSEFYKKKSLKIVDLLTSLSANPITNLVDVSDGNHMGISDKFIERGIPYYRGQDIHNFFIEYASPICIDKDTYNTSYMHRSHLKKGDVLLSIVGTIGEVALVSKDDDATCNCKLAILRPHDVKQSALIALYLKSKYGFDQVDKFKRGAVQMGYLLEDMNQIMIPKFSDAFGAAIEGAIGKVKELTEQSIEKYSDAENHMMSELGIDMSTITSGGTSIKSFRECFNVQNRIDSEFYQPKYDSILNAIVNYDVDALPLDKLVCYLFTGECAEEYYEYSKNLCHFVRGTDIHDGLVDIDFNYAVERDKHSKFLSTGDIITGRVGTIGRFGVIQSALDGAVCSDNVLCFHLPDEYLPNVYALYFNSPAIKELTERMSRGSVQQRLNQETLRELLVPYIHSDVQTDINDMIEISFNLKMKSEKLLKNSIQAVEMAIEQNEIIATDWLEEQIKNILSE